MIATGGLLRINARRQDPSKPHKPHAHKRKTKKRHSEVVVVKGKLKLCSLSGLVAALGVLVLMVGVAMAALGYWPRAGLFNRVQEAALASVSSSSSTSAQGGEGGEELQMVEGGDGGGAEDTLNQTEPVNGTRHLHRGFLEDFLGRYLYSDRLKVFGPLIMGIGIFLFICGNAVLHENRDKKTKVINLRDIYSTVIDLHSLRRPNSSSSCSANPLNGLVNYIQSKSLECKPCAFPASLMIRREGGAREGGGVALSRQPLCVDSDGGGDVVFSIYQEQLLLPDSSAHRLSLPPSFSPPPRSASLQMKELSFFTLPLRRPQLLPPHRRHSARARTGWSRGEEGTLPPPLCSSSTPPSPTTFQGEPSSSLHRQLLLSSSSLTQLSLSSLSRLLSSPSSELVTPCRRRSLPTGNPIAGYSQLTHAEDESFESTEVTSSHHVTSEEMTSQRKYSNREELRMIPQGDSGERLNKETGGDMIDKTQ